MQTFSKKLIRAPLRQSPVRDADGVTFFLASKLKFYLTVVTKYAVGVTGNSIHQVGILFPRCSGQQYAVAPAYLYVCFASRLPRLWSLTFPALGLYIFYFFIYFFISIYFIYFFILKEDNNYPPNFLPSKPRTSPIRSDPAFIQVLPRWLLLVASFIDLLVELVLLFVILDVLLLSLTPAKCNSLP